MLGGNGRRPTMPEVQSSLSMYDARRTGLDICDPLRVTGLTMANIVQKVETVNQILSLRFNWTEGK